MVTHHVPAVTTPSTVLCWILRRDMQKLTCEVDMRADRSYDVVVVPHWDVSLAAVEHFEALPEALLRHAEVARRLREDGWSVEQHVQPDQAPLAA